MKNNPRLAVLCLTVFLFRGLHAQDFSNIKFGKISNADFQLTAEKFDSGANAVIIADIGNVKFEGNNEGSFSVVSTHFIRVKINNKNGFDIGNQEILLYYNGAELYDKLYSIKASTFNLENGVIQETKLDEKSIFSQKLSRNIEEKKFSMPGLKEGAIFDIEYVVKSPFLFRLDTWSFQGEYPRLWSEYTVTIPPPLHYGIRKHGNQEFFIDTAKQVFLDYNVRQINAGTSDDNYTISGNSTVRRWVKVNVPALHEEPYTTSVENYYSKKTFQLEYIQWGKDGEKHYQKATWADFCKELMSADDFGRTLTGENGWMSNELNSITKGLGSDEEKTYKIYCYFRDNFKSDGSESLYRNSTLKDVFARKSGSATDINLLMTAMLIKAGIQAEPMILSTRDHGMAYSGYPIGIEYNYVVCAVHFREKLLTLDVSKPYLKYGDLPLACYNGYAHLVNEENPMPVLLTADSIQELSVTNVIIINDEKGKPSGGFSCVPGRSESYRIREEIGGSSLKTYEKKISDGLGGEFSVENFGIDSLKQYELPLTVHYDFTPKKMGSEDILYFNPMLDQGYRTNPFKSANRQYPVEMSFCMDEVYILNMDIPVGYQVDELPKSARVAYNDTEGMFEYMVQKGEGSVQLTVRVKLNKAFFPTEEYGVLRDFFANVVKKESEQFVFKKIK